MELQGKIIACLEPKTGESKKNAGEMWMSQDYVLEYQSGEYSRKLCFNVWGADRITRFNLHVGDFVAVSFDIDAREWNGRWFTDIKAWDVKPVEATAPADAPNDAPTMEQAKEMVMAKFDAEPVDPFADVNPQDATQADIPF